MSESDESLLKRLRESVLRARQTPERSTQPETRQEVNMRNAVRKLARGRVSETLRQLRATRGLTYEQVREKTGLAPQLLYDMEYRDRRLTLAELQRLAQCYEVSVNDLLGIDLEE
jgi:DNA-binding Xre family transcriptional regulator